MALNRTIAPPVDPDVKVPRAVREAAERSAATQKAVYGTDEPPVLEPPVAAPPAAPPSGEQSPTPAAGAPPPPAVGETPPQEPQPPIDWEQKYKTDYGRLDADRKRAQQTITQLTERLTHLERQAATAPQPQPQEPRRLQLSEEEMNDYGQPFIEMVQRIAQHVVDQRVEPIVSEVGRTQRQIGVHQNLTMHQQMDALYPDWQRMNADERFIQWTQLPDPYSGVIRGRLMQDAWNSGDARRVYAFFQGFLAEEAALSPQGHGRQPASAPEPPVGNGVPVAAPPLTLEQLAAPGGSRSAQSPPAEKRVYTAADISRFYTEVGLGKWKHREQERAAIDADIYRAQHEGRIIQTAPRYTPPPPPRGYTN